MNDDLNHLRAIIASVPGVVWEAWGEPDASTQRIDYVSEHVEPMLGYSVGEWLAQPNFWLTLVHPDDRERAASEAAAIFSGGETGSSQFRWITKDGRVLWVLASSTVVRDAAGASIGMRGVTLDITAQKRAEQRLGVQDGVTRILAEGDSLEAVAPLVLQAIGEQLEWAAGAAWAVNRSDFLTNVSVWHSAPISIPQFEIATRQATFARGVGLPGRVWATRRPAWIADVTQDANFPRASTAADADLHAAFGFPVLLRGDVLGVMEFFSREIREPDQHVLDLAASIGSQIGQFIAKKSSESALRESELERSEIIRSALDAVITMGASGVIKDWNPRASGIFGWRAGEAVGQRLSELIIPTRYREAHERGLRRFLQTGEGPVVGDRIEIEGLHRDGHEFPVELTVSAARIGDSYSFSAFVRDITERRLKDQMKDDFVAFASHELKNPLTTVTGMAQWLARRVAGSPGGFDADTREAVETLRDEAGRMAEIIDVFLDLTLIESDRLTVNFEAVDLRRVVVGEADALRLRFPDVTVETAACADDAVEISCDETRVRQVLRNLLDNAAKYAGARPHVTVSLVQDGEVVRIDVTDNGPGIPPEDRPHILERFYRGRGAGASAKRGLGVGLFITSQLVARLGGTLTFTSSEGAGTSFVVELPVDCS